MNFTETAAQLMVIGSVENRTDPTTNLLVNQTITSLLCPTANTIAAFWISTESRRKIRQPILLAGTIILFTFFLSLLFICIYHIDNFKTVDGNRKLTSISVYNIRLARTPNHNQDSQTQQLNI
ncbi:hypothetical protein QR98_0001700 [Sarcoptes scabiei]|uniref:Uncharacterized protein n=1 Tax=Sarcoptes scabiei TaxID=52283 RepID=A0A131ZT95_SARSC|nr:hypothetical protein QR98_0001700 [Sarcoptes scabiei]